MYIKRLWANLSLSVNKRSPWSFFLIISLPPSLSRLVFVHLPESACNQRALSSQKGHPVPLMVFWFIPSSFLHSHPSLSPPFFFSQGNWRATTTKVPRRDWSHQLLIDGKGEAEEDKKATSPPTTIFARSFQSWQIISIRLVFVLNSWYLYLINQSWLIV